MGRRARRRRLVRGTLGGIAGGLAASSVMNVFISKAGEKLTQSLMSDEDRSQQRSKQQEQSGQEQESKEDATMKAAEGASFTR
jgi:hypothetical protein